MKHTHLVIVIMLLMNATLGTVTFKSQIVYAQTETLKPAQEAPFSITVDPDNITVNLGEDIVFLIGIEAEEEFISQVDLVLELTFVGYNMTVYMFPLRPTFPRMQEATIDVPSRARAGIATGTLKATSGDYIVIKTIRISLVSEDETSDVHTLIEKDAEAPFTIMLMPFQLTAKPGSITYFDIRMNVDEGFNESISFREEFTSLNYNLSDEWVVNPPHPSYPFSLRTRVSIPEYLVPGVSFQMRLLGTSGIYSIEKTAKISLRGSSGRKSLLGWFFLMSDMIYSNLLAEFLKLSIQDELNDPDNLQRLVEARDKAYQEANEREKEIVQERNRKAREAEKFVNIGRVFGQVRDVLFQLIEYLQLFARTVLQYCGDTSTMIYHKTSSTECEYTGRENRQYFFTNEEAELAGYTPCSVCKP